MMALKSLDVQTKLNDFQSVEATDPPIFTGPSEVFVADTCAPLRDAGRTGDIGLWAYGRGNYPGLAMDPDVLPQLKSVGSWEITADQGWGLDWHRNEGIEFTCISAGSVPFSCEAEEFDFMAGHISITRPWQLHRVGRPAVTSSTLTWFILDVGVRRPNEEWNWPSWLPIPTSDLNRLTELLSHNERPVWRASKSLLAAVDTLERTLKREASQPMARIATSIAAVFIELRDLLESQEPVLDPYLSSTERTVRLFLRQLDGRLSEPWTIDQMASECGLGKTRFGYYCKQIMNVSPLEYVQSRRIERAKSLLVDTDLRIADITQMCGFQSSQYFSTIFRRYTAESPVQFRKNRHWST